MALLGDAQLVVALPGAEAVEHGEGRVRCPRSSPCTGPACRPGRSGRTGRCRARSCARGCRRASLISFTKVWMALSWSPYSVSEAKPTLPAWRVQADRRGTRRGSIVAVTPGAAVLALVEHGRGPPPCWPARWCPSWSCWTTIRRRRRASTTMTAITATTPTIDQDRPGGAHAAGEAAPARGRSIRSWLVPPIGMSISSIGLRRSWSGTRDARHVQGLVAGAEVGGQRGRVALAPRRACPAATTWPVAMTTTWVHSANTSGTSCSTSTMVDAGDLVELAQQRDERLGLALGDPGGGLVEQQQPRAGQHHRGQVDHPAGAGRQVRDAVVAEPVEAERRRSPGRPRRACRARAVAAPGSLQRGAQTRRPAGGRPR